MDFCLVSGEEKSVCLLSFNCFKVGICWVFQSEMSFREGNFLQYVSNFHWLFKVKIKNSLSGLQTF